MNINSKTKLCCVIGNPVEHSVSPILHNAAYEALGLNFVYVPFHVEDIKSAINGIKALGITGISVTIPHKLAIMEYLDEIDPIAQNIGAVNTVLNDNGKLIGSNTDYIGAIHALEEKTSITGKKVAVIGAGGAARAIVFGLKEKNCDITIFNRKKDMAEKLAHDSTSIYKGFEALHTINSFDILINATPVGMSPKTGETVIPKEYLSKNMIVFDIVYNPKETQLIQEAITIGCTIVYGYKMLLYQAIDQFELFTKQRAPIDVMEQALISELERKKE